MSAFAQRVDRADAPRDSFAASLPQIPEADRKVVVRPEKLESPILKYALQSDALAGATELTTVISRDARMLVRETVVVEAKHQAGPTVTLALLPHHAKELEQIRTLENRGPGVLRFTVSAGARVIMDTTLADVLMQSTKLAKAVTVGATRSVDVKIPAPKKVAATGVYPDPECESQCNDTYIQCYYEICDQRGNCSYCWDDYEWCAAQCPQICEEPKSVRTFTHWGYVGSVDYGIHCMLNPYDNQKYYYQLWQDIFATQQIRRTEHCDGSYTDEVLSTTYSYSYCYDKLIPSSWCIYAEGVLPLNAEC